MVRIRRALSPELAVYITAAVADALHAAIERRVVEVGPKEKVVPGVAGDPVSEPEPAVQEVPEPEPSKPDPVEVETPEPQPAPEPEPAQAPTGPRRWRNLRCAPSPN